MSTTVNKKKDNKKPSKDKKKPSNFLKELIGIMSWVTVLMLWCSAGSVFINPNLFQYLSIAGLAFPFFLAGVLVMLVVCLLLARRKIWIPLLGLAVCLLSIRSYCPVNLPWAHPKSAYKFISYNTMGFATGTKDSAKEEGILEYLTKSGGDFFCFQEGHCVPAKLLGEKILPRLDKTFGYHDTLKISESILGCCSKYPIIGKELICQDDMNGAVAFKVLLGANDTLRIVNCHLKSMGLSDVDRKQYSKMVKHLNDSNAETHSKLLISKISKATVIRANQADDVARYIERHAGKNIIVCGDFNDTPISYAHHRIHSTGLTDAYSTTANGIGRSFNRDAIIVRIDHLFCSDHWKPYGFHIDKTIQSSDHYPILGYLERLEPKK